MMTRQAGTDMEEEAPPAKEPDEQIIIGKKCPFLEEKKTGASQQYNPLTMPYLPGIPCNILIQFLVFVLFYWCLGLLLYCYLCFILELPSFAKEMIRNAVD